LASGICGTDIEILLPQETPNSIVPGHEGVGEVVEVDKATMVSPGDKVMLDCHITCRKCDFCMKGDVIFCKELRAIGFDLDGTYAQYILMPEESLRPLPNDIDIETGILIGDALGTPYHAIKKLGITADEYVTIFGVGPLGMLAVFCVASLGGRAIAVDINQNRLDMAYEFGAFASLNGNRPDLVEHIFSITDGYGASASVQCTPSGSALNNALDSLQVRGRLAQVGVCRNVNLNPMRQINDREITIVGSRNFNCFELDEIIDFVRDHPEIKKIVTHRYSLDKGQDAFCTAIDGKGLKVIIIP
jgi:propanol-preferring alcohol dehydrogenase